MKIYFYFFCVFNSFLSFGQLLPSAYEKIHLELFVKRDISNKKDFQVKSTFVSDWGSLNSIRSFAEIEFKDNHTYQFKMGRIYPYQDKKDTVIYIKLVQEYG